MEQPVWVCPECHRTLHNDTPICKCGHEQAGEKKAKAPAPEPAPEPEEKPTQAMDTESATPLVEPAQKKRRGRPRKIHD